jgi:hypothetical protein
MKFNENNVQSNMVNNEFANNNVNMNANISIPNEMMQPIMKGPQIDEFSTPNQSVMPSGNMGMPPMGNQMMNPNGNQGNNGNFGGMMNPTGF